MPIPREMKLRRKKGPALGGVASGKWKNMCCVRAPSGRLRALASSSLLVPSPLQPKHAPSARPHQGFSERGGRGCTRWAHGERTVSARLAHARTQWYYRRGCPRPHLMAKQNSLVLTALTTPPTPSLALPAHSRSFSSSQIAPLSKYLPLPLPLSGSPCIQFPQRARSLPVFGALALALALGAGRAASAPPLARVLGLSRPEVRFK